MVETLKRLVRNMTSSSSASKHDTAGIKVLSSGYLVSLFGYVLMSTINRPIVLSYSSCQNVAPSLHENVVTTSQTDSYFDLLDFYYPLYDKPK